MRFGNLQLGKEESVADYSYTVLFEPAEEGGYVAFCPALPGLVTEGDSFAETRERVTEAIEAYRESLRKDGLPIPPDKKIEQHLPALKPARVLRALERAGFFVHHIKDSHYILPLIFTCEPGT